MGFKGATVNRLQGGLGRTNPTEDGVMLLVVQGAVATADLALKTAVQLLSIENAEAIGITASYDDTNSILAHHHIDEFFRIAPDGNLFVVLDDGTLTDAELKTILLTNSEINGFGIVRNAVAALGNFPEYVAQKQAIITALRTANRNVSFCLVEGNVFDAATLISAYPDNRENDGENIGVVIAQDPIIAAIKEAYKNYAAIGSALGGLSVRGVHENLGSVDIENKPQDYKGDRDYPLTNTARSRWLSAALQNGVSFNSLSSTEIDFLNTTAYIFAGNYNGYAGIFFSDAHTSTESASDYSRIENNRTWDKGADLLRYALLPRVKSNLQKDPTTGAIAAVEAAELEAIGKTALQEMVTNGEVTEVDVYVDPSQVINNDEALTVTAQLVKNGILHKISIDLGLTNSL